MGRDKAYIIENQRSYVLRSRNRTFSYGHSRGPSSSPATASSGHADPPPSSSSESLNCLSPPESEVSVAYVHDRKVVDHLVTGNLWLIWMFTDMPLHASMPGFLRPFEEAPKFCRLEMHIIDVPRAGPPHRPHFEHDIMRQLLGLG